MDAAGVWRAADLFKDDWIWQPYNVLCCPIIHISLSIYTHTSVSCVVYLLLLLFSLSLLFLNLFTSLSVQPDWGVFFFLFSLAEAHMQQQHKYEHKSLIESMRSHSSILSFWIHKPESRLHTLASLGEILQSASRHIAGMIEIYTGYIVACFLSHSAPLPLPLLSVLGEWFPAPSLKGLRLLVSSFNLLRLFSNSVQSFTLKMASTSLYLLWGSLICLEFSQTSILTEFQHLFCDAGCLGSLFLTYLSPILLLSLCMGIFLSAQPGLHLCCCCCPIISLKVVPSQKHIWTVSPFCLQELNSARATGIWSIFTKKRCTIECNPIQHTFNK